MKRILTFLIIFFIQITVSNSQYWKEIKSIPPPFNTNYWLDVFFHPSNSSFGWVCGFNGMVIRTTDGGNSWLGSTVPNAYHLEHIHFPTLTVGYTSGPEGIFKTTNGGQNWFDITPDLTKNYWGCYFIDANIGLVLAEGCNGTQNFYKTTNGGTNWTNFPGSEANSGLTDLILYDANGLGYAVSSGKIWQTNNGGSSWAVIASSGTNVWNEEIAHSGSSFLVPYAGTTCSGQGGDGGMRFSNDMGANWRSFQTGFSMFGTYLIDGSKGWACGDNRGVYYTSDAGQSWVLRNCGIPDETNLDDVWFVNENLGYVVGHGVYRLSGAEQFVSKDTLKFDNLCKNENLTDSLLISNLSFSQANVELALVNNTGNHFRLISPNPNIVLNSCEEKVVTIMFAPTDENSHEAKLRITFNPGTGNEKIYFIELIGIVRKSTAFPQDTLIVVNNLNCSVTRVINLPWFSETLGEQIIGVDNLNKSSNILLTSPIPLKLIPPVTNTAFTITLIDTGWYEARYKFTLFPCNRDTFVTVRAYGASPIISHRAKQQLNSTCRSIIYDTIRVFNTGNDVLNISDVWLSPEINEFEIIGWVNVSLPMKIDRGGFEDLIISYRPVTSGTHITRLAIANNDSTRIFGFKNPYYIDLRGVSSITNLTDTIRIDFGNLCIGETKSDVKIIRNTGNLDAEVNIESTPEELKLTISDINSIIKKNDLTRLTAVFTASKVGKFNYEIQMSSKPCDEKTLILISANVIKNDLEVTPDKISGLVKVGESIEKVVRVQSLSSFDVNIKSVTITPGSSDWQYSVKPLLPMVLLSGQGTDFTMTFNPTNAGKFQGKVVIETEGLCNETYYVDIDLSSFSKFVDINPTSIDYGNFFCEYNYQDKEIKISNLGFSQDTISKIELIQDSDVFEIINLPEIPLLIDAKDEFTLQVRFKKQDLEGIFTGNIIIETIGDDGQNFIIPLKANYSKSIINPESHSINMGEFELCSEPRSVEFKFKNLGLLGDKIILKSNNNSDLFRLLQTEASIAPDEEVIFKVTFDPIFANNTGNYKCEITFITETCFRELKIFFEADIIKSKLSVLPDKVDFGSKWSEETITKNIKLIHNGGREITINDVLLDNSTDYKIIDTPIDKKLKNGEFIDFSVSYISTDTNNHQGEIIVHYSSDCPDSAKIELNGSVRSERYDIILSIDRYEALAGDLIDIYVKLSGGSDRLIPDEIRLEISFDKQLFYPNKVSILDNGVFSDFSYSYSSGVIYGLISKAAASKILQKSAEIVKIQGIVLASIPDSTLLKISKFDVLSDKIIDIQKKDGLLKIIDYCIGTTQLNQFRYIPKFTVSSGSIANNGKLSYSILSSTDLDIFINIKDLNGNVCVNNIIKSYTSNNSYELDFSLLPSGLYFVEFESQYQKETLKIINIK